MHLSLSRLYVITMGKDLNPRPTITDTDESDRSDHVSQTKRTSVCVDNHFAGLIPAQVYGLVESSPTPQCSRHPWWLAPEVLIRSACRALPLSCPAFHPRFVRFAVDNCFPVKLIGY